MLYVLCKKLNTDLAKKKKKNPHSMPPPDTQRVWHCPFAQFKRVLFTKDTQLRCTFYSLLFSEYDVPWVKDHHMLGSQDQATD